LKKKRRGERLGKGGTVTRPRNGSTKRVDLSQGYEGGAVAERPRVAQQSPSWEDRTGKRSSTRVRGEGSPAIGISSSKGREKNHQQKIKGKPPNHKGKPTVENRSGQKIRKDNRVEGKGVHLSESGDEKLVEERALRGYHPDTVG